MSDWTRKNLEDVDTVGAPDGSVTGYMVRKYLDSPELGVSLFRYAPKARGPYGHKHVTQEEVYVVVGGAGRLKLGEEVIDIKRWDAIRVAPHVVRAFEGGPDGLELICLGGTRPPEGDGELIKDFWP